MKSPLFTFMLLLLLSLCSFVMFKQEKSTPIDEALRIQYLALFRKIELPYTISVENNAHLKAAPISLDYKHFIPEMMYIYSRTEPPTYYPDALISSTDKYDAVLYVKLDKFENFILGHADFILQTIDKKGGIISSSTIIDRRSLGQGAKATISKNLRIRSTEIIIHSHFIEGKGEINHTQKNRQKFNIDADGKISRR